MTCQWLYGEPSERNFCGRPGYPWCKAHRKVVYKPAVEVNMYGIAKGQSDQSVKRRISNPRMESIAEKIRKEIWNNPDAPATELAERFGCSAHHVRKIRRLALGSVSTGNKAAAIRMAIDRGLGNREIAEAVGCDNAYVRAVRYRMKEAIQ